MTPHEQMMKWDNEGTSYFISHLIINGKQVKEDQLDILQHNANWMQVRANNSETWVNMAHVSAVVFETQ